MKNYPKSIRSIDSSLFTKLFSGWPMEYSKVADWQRIRYDLYPGYLEAGYERERNLIHWVWGHKY